MFTQSLLGMYRAFDFSLIGNVGIFERHWYMPLVSTLPTQISPPKMGLVSFPECFKGTCKN